MGKLFFIADSSEVIPSDYAFRAIDMYDNLADAVESAGEFEVVVELVISKTYTVKETKRAIVLKDYAKSTVAKKSTNKKKGAK